MYRYIKSSVDWSYYDKPEFQKLEQRYLPRSGEGENKAEQLMTAVTKLVYRWYNDGDVYDNTHFMHGELVGNDLSSYANWIYENGPKAAKYVLLAIFKCDTEDDYEEILKDLNDAALNEGVLAELEQHGKVGSIYNCNGPFECVDYEKDEEDW